MKYLNLKVLILKIILVFVWGCNQLDDGSYTVPITLYEKVGGNWSLNSLKMVDEFAKTNGIKPDEQNLEQLFNYNQFALQLRVDSEFNPTTYEVMGTVPPLFAPKGYWKLSSAFQPTSSDAVRVQLYKDVDKKQLIDELLLTAVPGAGNAMHLKLVRSDEGVAYISYVFDLTTTN